MDEADGRGRPPNPPPASIRHRIARHLADELLRGRRFFKAKEIASQVGATSQQVANHLRALRESSVFSISEQARSSHSTTWRIEFKTDPWEVFHQMRGLLLLFDAWGSRRAAT
jgi:transcription initiation factor IIE alpha subunit